jgi:hypothetical protein
VEDYLRTRCSTRGDDVFTTWRGEVLSRMPGETARHLFDVVGMNVARCARDGRGRWYQTSRELMYYLDPRTGQRLERWTNPWTGAEVNVVHVANSPVQSHLGSAPPSRAAYGTVSFRINVPVRYPNPLASDPSTARFSPHAFYEAMELFVLSTAAAEARDPSRSSVSRMNLSWHRIGPWLPWMDMGDRPGELVYSATGERVRSVDELPPLLRDEISSRLPLFRAAPRCFLAEPNETSWTHFRRHLASYSKGERFPPLRPVAHEQCAE